MISGQSSLLGRKEVDGGLTSYWTDLNSSQIRLLELILP